MPTPTSPASTCITTRVRRGPMVRKHSSVIASAMLVATMAIAGTTRYALNQAK